jgi:hypothetical protein
MSGDGREMSDATKGDVEFPGEEPGMEDVDLTPEEKMAFQRLPREAEPSRILEERIVTALRGEGILGGRAGGVAASGSVSGPSTWLRPWMLAASMAASVVLFASGVFLGHRMASESTAQAFLAVREQDATQVALRIQEAGTAYVSALVALGELGQRVESGESGGGSLSQASAELLQGSEVGLGALYAAAYELARLNPDDPDVLRVFQILEERRAREAGVAGEPRSVVWF